MFYFHFFFFISFLLFSFFFFFFFNDTATTEIYTLSLHDALPISPGRHRPPAGAADADRFAAAAGADAGNDRREPVPTDRGIAPNACERDRRRDGNPGPPGGRASVRAARGTDAGGHAGCA